jgi:hypothetical protein
MKAAPWPAASWDQVGYACHRAATAHSSMMNEAAPGQGRSIIELFGEKQNRIGHKLPAV